MNNTLSNGFLLLEHLAGTAREYSVKELAELFDLPNSHVCRLLKTLKEHGYVKQGQKRKYSVALKLASLSNAVIGNHQVRKRCRPYLQKLVLSLQTPVFLADSLDGRCIIIDVVNPLDRPSDTGLVIGKMNELNVTSSGKLVAAFQPEKVYRKLIEESNPQRHTERTLVDTDDIINELKLSRERGLAVSYQEHFSKTFSVAAPVFDFSGGFAGAISTFDWDPADEKKIRMVEECREAAIAASFAIGYTGPHKSENVNAARLVSDLVD